MSEINVRYMERSRLYYQAQGYETPYQWAHFDEVPFAALKKPLSECKATIVTTGMPDDSFTSVTRSLQIGDMHQIPEGLYTAELAWDKDATHTDDLDSYFPVRHLTEKVKAGRLGRLADCYFCVPTSYSQRQTIEQDAPEIVRSCLSEGVDVAFLVPL